MAERLFKPGDLRHADDADLREGTEHMREVVERLERYADYLDLWARYQNVAERLRLHDHTDLLPREG